MKPSTHKLAFVSTPRSIDEVVRLRQLLKVGLRSFGFRGRRIEEIKNAELTGDVKADRDLDATLEPSVRSTSPLSSEARKRADPLLAELQRRGASLNAVRFNVSSVGWAWIDSTTLSPARPAVHDEPSMPDAA